MQRVTYPSYANLQKELDGWRNTKRVETYPNVAAFGSALAAAEQNSQANLMGKALGPNNIKEVNGYSAEIFDDARHISEKWNTTALIKLLYGFTGRVGKYLFIIYADQFPSSGVVVYSLDA